MSLTSIVGCFGAAAVFTAFAALGWHSWAYALAAVVGATLIVALHHDNIDRLRAGTERKIGQRVEVAH
jgi:glycerol-3-phosphate acyltransferase PlsY